MNIWTLTAQNYIVLRIKDGKIHDLTQKTDLFPTQSISAEDVLSFQDQKASATLMDENRNIYQLTISGKLSTKKVKDLLSQKPIESFSSVRRLEATTVDNLEGFFGKRMFFILGDALKIRLSGKYVAPNQYLAIKAENNGSTKPIKIPRLANDTLVISKDFIKPYLVGDSLVNIYLVDLTIKKAILETAITIAFVPEQELKDCFKAFKLVLEKQANEKMNQEKQKNEYIEYFEKLYGYTNHAALEKWLKSNGFLPK
jgi:hypothetical protein